MDSKSAFNAAVCIIGILLLLIHTVDLILKKNKRKDEKNLLIFIVFTAVHFATYLSFTLVKANYTSDNLIICFYSIFYVMNNMEVLLLFFYAISFVTINEKIKDITTIVILGLLAIFIVLDIVNIFNHMFFYSVNGVYTRAKLMFLSQGYQFVALAVVFIITVLNRKLNLTQKIAFSFYCLLPLVAIVLQNLLPGYAIAYLSIVISIEILFLFVNVRKNVELANEAKRSKEAEIKLMMSQIQPHFIYNTLASISTLIKIDPDKAQKALDEFTEYLRANLSSLTKTGLINFKEELRHIETYLSLEKMRFDERLSVNYDIKVVDFLVPPLSIQPLVENAVKHGILQKLEGGTISIKTYEDEKAYYVEIKDDGVGFDLNNLDPTDNNHIGLNNVKYRLSSMCNGELNIYSVIDKGTTMVVTFNK